ncbi:lipopolysaccharide biosynthesis protein [Kitasatospora sp. NPDC056138]|uniref:lipopolysaccharide biosynthesis protein n=1 Tax=Kitasatospora sp. NPDC056138 TaxID=3345724 RepID=UPI0035D69B96
MNPTARLRTALPPGTQAVAAGTVVLGAASYLHLAVAGHSLSTRDMAGVSVLWTIVMSVGIGLFFPIEQELTRTVAARAVRGEGAGGVLRRAALLTGGVLAVVLGLMAAAARPLAGLLFHGDLTLLAALGAAFAAMACCYLTRGVLAGLGRFGAYGTQLGLDGGARILLALGCAVAGPHSALAFSLILTAAPLLALLATLPLTVRAARPGPPVGWAELLRGLGLLVCSTLLAQWMVSAAVVSVQLLEPGAVDLITALLSALVLARVPIFVFGALQASLLSGLAGSAAQGRYAAFTALLRRAALAVGLLSLALGLPAVALGPWLIRLLFAAPPVLTRPDFLWLALGTLCYLLAMVLGQGLIVLHRHRVQLACWALGAAVLAAVTLLPGPLGTRVCLAYAAGTAGTAAGMAAGLLRRPGAAVRTNGATRTLDTV